MSIPCLVFYDQYIVTFNKQAHFSLESNIGFKTPSESFGKKQNNKQKNKKQKQKKKQKKQKKTKKTQKIILLPRIPSTLCKW